MIIPALRLPAVLLAAALAVGAGALRAEPPDREAAIALLVAQMNSNEFAVRQSATRRLADVGTAALPYLLDALGSDSDELRSRAVRLLDRFSFDELADCCLQGVVLGPRAQRLVSDRSRHYLAATCQSTKADQLFEMWKIDSHKLVEQVADRLELAREPAEFRTGLVALRDFAGQLQQFGGLVAQLDELGLTLDQHDSPARVVMELCAKALRDEEPARLVFAQEYVRALQSLSRQFDVASLSPQAGRREAAHRAGWSRGALVFLVQLFDPAAPAAQLLEQRYGVSTSELRAEYLTALAAPQNEQFMWGVGKTHIAEMLFDVLREWPDAPTDGVVEQLAQRICETIHTGDKPRALCCLDALRACRSLTQQGLSLDSGLGSTMAQRLLDRALAAESPRDFHPTRIAHDKFLSLVGQDVSPGTAGFPDELFEQHLRGDEPLSETQRLALERYVRIVERLTRWGLSCADAELRPFVSALRRALRGQPDSLSSALTYLDAVEREERDAVRHRDQGVLIARLRQWNGSSTP